MNLLSLDIRVGSAGVTHLGKREQEFHEEVVRMVRAPTTPVMRLGLANCSPISPRQMVHERRCIGGIVQTALQGVSAPVETCLIDFTSNQFFVVGEPLLLALADAFALAFESNLCSYFILLVPQLPGPKSASLNRFAGLTTNPVSPTIVLVSNAGETQAFGQHAAKVPRSLSSYGGLIDARFGSPEARLARKCVRRLGHFKTSDPPGRQGPCRHHSYFVFDCDTELLALLSNWWRLHAPNTKAVLYDLKHNPSFRNAIKTLADSQEIAAERVVDALANRQLGSLIASMGPCTLILDVVEQGEVLRHYIEQLAGSGIKVNHKVLAAVSKAGSIDVAMGDYRVHSFLQRPRDPVVAKCIQCELKLPLSAEAAEPQGPIRTYDMLHMANTCGWEPEPAPEVPDNIGLAFANIPAFTPILQEYGDWLGYKLYDVLRSGLSPDDWFVVHPDESDSTVLAERLQACMDEPLCVVRVPRDAIKAAQMAGNQWHQVLHRYNTEFWTQQLTSMVKSSALILDIFNASGSTAATLQALLRHYRIEPFAYMCLANFEPTMKSIPGSGVPIHTLYDWYNPRTLQSRSAQIPTVSAHVRA